MLNMDIDPSRIQNIGKEAKSELLRWKSQCKPSSPHHINPASLRKMSISTFYQA